MKYALVCLALLGCGKPEKKQVADDKAKVEKAVDVEQQKQAEAVKAASDAVKAADDAKATVDKLAADQAALSTKIDAAIDATANAQNDADRAAAKAKLEDLRKQKADLDATITTAKAASVKAERGKGVPISKECMDNPLAKGCS